MFEELFTRIIGKLRVWQRSTRDCTRAWQYRTRRQPNQLPWWKYL